jgi:2-amino-4-hydroxy-6-hydroxymethyldihydropteridine diphosphokinase
MSRCCLGLGGNLGDVPATIARAVSELDGRASRVLAVSHLFRTQAVGASAGGAFLNAAALVETELSPEPLLDRLQQIEDRLGRTREIRWGPRTIDLDLLLYEDVVLHNERLDVPHPGCLYRRFVLDPLSEIAGDWRHPETGLTVDAMRTSLLRRPLPVTIGAGLRTQRELLIEEIRRRIPDVQAVFWEMPMENRHRGLVSCLSSQNRGNAESSSQEELPALLVNLDAPGAGDTSLVLSMIQAMVDVPTRAGFIPRS